MTVTPTQCVADGGLINPALFPAKAADLDPEKIRVSAASVKTMGTSVHDETSSIATSWSGLTHSYEAPEQQRVYDLMRPAVTSATELRTAFHTMAGHLETYATALAGIKPRLASFEQRAAAFRAEVVNGVQVDASSSNQAGFGDYAKGAVDWIPGVDERQVTVPWYEDGDTVQRNKDLLAEYAELLEDVSTASAQCANDINRLVKNMCVTPVEALPAEAFTNPAQPMPWGEPREEDRNCPESVGSGAYTFGKDIVQGAGMLVLGYNPETGGWFEGKAYGQAWGGLGDLVGSIALFATPVAWVGIGMQATGNTDNDFVRFMDDRYDTVVGGLGSLVGYDHGAEDGWHKWKEDGVAAGTGAVLSVGTFFIPGAGQVGSFAKGASIAAKGAKFVAMTAEFVVQGGSWVVKGGIKVVSALREALVFGGDLLTGNLRGPALAGVGAGGGGIRFNATAMASSAADGASSVTPRRSPVSSDLFPPSRGSSPIGSSPAPRLTAPDVDVTPARPAGGGDTPGTGTPRTEGSPTGSGGQRPGSSTPGHTDPGGAGSSPRTEGPSTPADRSGPGTRTEDGSAGARPDGGAGPRTENGAGPRTEDGSAGTRPDGGAGPRTEDGPGTRTEDGSAGTRTEDGAGPRTEDGVGPRTEDGPGTRTDDGAGDGTSTRDGDGTHTDDGTRADDGTARDDGTPEGDGTPRDDGAAEGDGTAEGDGAAAEPKPPARDVWQEPAAHPRPEVAKTVTIDADTGGQPGKQTPFARRTDLEPSTLYRVTTRTGIESDFYTNGAGKVVYVETTYGKTGALNWDLMKPQGDVTYVVHPQGRDGSGSYTHVFQTDKYGRTVSASTDDLQRGVADRSESIQQRVGRVGTKLYSQPYEGGHLLANMFGGGPESTNLVSMMEVVNRGKKPSFSSLEAFWDQQIAAGRKVRVEITTSYKDKSAVVPRGIRVTSWVNGSRGPGGVFANVP